MAKKVKKTKVSAPKTRPTPPKDYDAGIRAQLEPYGLELNDIVAVLEEDPSMLQYVEQGEKGKSIADMADAKARRNPGGHPKGKCASRDTGAKSTINRSAATSILNGNGNDIQLNAQGTGDYFSVTYHTAETVDSLTYAPGGALLNWENQDDPKKRRNPNANKKPGGFKFGHVTVKRKDEEKKAFYSDGNENIASLETLVLHKGRNGEPRYGSLSYVTFPKDVTFSPELVNLALMRKKERETDRQIAEAEMPETPKNADAFFKKNPRLGYLVLKQVNPNVPFELTADGGAKLLQYYHNLPKNSPERAALNLFAAKNIKNTMDYAAVNNAVQEVSNEVLRLRNPEAYAARQPATEKEMRYLCQAAPTYIYQLQQALYGTAQRKTSNEYEAYVQTLNKNSAEYRAISRLAKKAPAVDANPAEVKLAIANIAKDHREVKPEEINNLFENTPSLVYYVQKEFGTQKAGGIRITSELHKYYDNLPKNSPERKAIDELAMAHLELSEVNEAGLSKSIQAMAHHYQPNRELMAEPLDNQTTYAPQKSEKTSADNKQAIRDSFKKMNSRQWSQLVDDYLKSSTYTPQMNAELKQQAAQAARRFETTLQSLFADNGNKISCKEAMKQGAELLERYIKLEDGKGKSLEGFIAFVEKAQQQNPARAKQNVSAKASVKKSDTQKDVNPLVLHMAKEKAGAAR